MNTLVLRWPWSLCDCPHKTKEHCLNILRETFTQKNTKDEVTKASYVTPFGKVKVPREKITNNLCLWNIRGLVLSEVSVNVDWGWDILEFWKLPKKYTQDSLSGSIYKMKFNFNPIFDNMQIYYFTTSGMQSSGLVFQSPDDVWEIFHFTFRQLIIQISINLLKYWDNITKFETILSNWAQICKLQLSFNNYMSYEHRKTDTFLGLENQSDRSLKITKLVSLERISFKLLKSWVKSLGNPTFWFFRKQN